MAIIARAPFNRRNRFILTASLSVGFGAILVPNWFSNVFTYSGGNQALLGFFDAIVLVMETGFAVTALLALLLNLTIAEELELDTRMLDGRAQADDRRHSMGTDGGSSGKGQAEMIKPVPEAKTE